jgi:CHAD domain-containing protein
MQTAIETERKYDVPDDFALPELAGAAGVTEVGTAEVHDLDATYFDTDGLDLARHRRTLRRRTGGSDAGWHLKTPGDGASRTEHRLPLGEDADTVPPELAAEVRAIVRDRVLRPVARLRTRRRESPLRDADGRTLALLAQDDVTAETDGAEQRWSELEVELVDGGANVLDAVERGLLKAGARFARGPSKLARALGDRGAPAAATPARKGATGAVGDYVRAQRDAIVGFDPAVRHGDREAVHKMRVATRRLRSTLRTYRDLWEPARVSFLRGELKWLAELIGGVRDGQVLTERLSRAIDEAGADAAEVGTRLREHLGAGVEQGRAALGAALDSARYLRLLNELDEFDVPAGGKAADRHVKRRTAKALTKADALLDTAERDYFTGHEDADEALHEARKAYKQARYAAEVFAPSVGKPAKRLVSRLTALQDVLGAHQDSVVARHLLRDLAGRAHAAGQNGFGYGVLHARQEQAGERALDDLPAARRAARRAKLRAWLS